MRRVECDRCHGTGKYWVPSKRVPGATYSGGDCFRCGGKGHQTDEDVKRNAAYDRYQFAAAAREMTA